MSGPTWLLLLGVLAAAVLVDARRRRTARRTAPRRPRRRYALLVVVAIVCGSSLIGSPAMAQPLNCKEAPEPDRPGTGLVGSLDPTRSSGGVEGSVYWETGYAGLIWHNYDLGCAGAAFNPASTTDTWLGNQVFNISKFVVGGVNWAHYLIAEGGEILAPLDELIVSAVTAMYESVFTPWIGVALAVLAALVLILTVRGDLAQQTRRMLFAVVALAVGSAAYLAPMGLSKVADQFLLDGVTTMQEGFLAQTGMGSTDTLPTVLVDQVLYQNWLRGVFGAPDVPQAEQFGRDLLRAQAFTIDEIDQHLDTPELVAEKKARYAAIAEQMGDRYAYFQGKAGSRIGAAVLSVLQAVCIAVFQLLSKLLVLVAMLLIRLMVIAAPAIAVVAILKPDILPALLRVGGAAVVNTLIVGAMAGLHALVVISLFRPEANIDLWLAMLVSGVVTVVLWAVARPFRRLVSMVSLTREQFGGIVPSVGDGPMARVWQRLRAAPADDRQTRWWEERRAAAESRREWAGARPESESAARVRATTTRVSPDPASAATDAQAVPAARRAALPAGSGSSPRPAPASPTWEDPGEIDDRTIYRRPDAVPLRPGGARPVDAEIVDGVPVYRIYRPRPSQQVYTPRGAG
ncbi:hypothetical protein SAMN05443637_112206 [Pseudonocardia thermophila]|uniref:TrbL/VirB6 plasmid conjugal transfer protein n=1 Tax=Pseudonocardia thermophila TaxID=1848 RepID=A0A1M6VLH8_PSETH|nr:hypothetical protein [Pseudonocardia thermophila]SHK82363.1 hypothetical protein SAMN05443637_112206 [Pseudonocardia thermophila]